MPTRAEKQEAIKLAAESDLATFIKLVAPHRMLGAVHDELILWWYREDAKSHQLTLLPRGHQKSALIAYRVAWEITRNPALTVMYISSTSGLAEKQLKFIKDIMTSKIYRRYWPEMVNEQEGQRERWTTTEFAVDHPVRKLEGVRDPTVFTAGLTTNTVGLHCDIAVLDDVVTNKNAYTEEGRVQVTELYSLLASIENAGASEWAVGTRYHPKDLYQDLLAMEEDIYDDITGDEVDKDSIYEVFQRQVEDQGDGKGEFLWERQRRTDGKWFGFDKKTLAKKRGQYLDRMQFRAQYYNDPNDPESMNIDNTKFQYYDRKHLIRQNGTWYMKDRALAVYASIDFAFSLRRKADYTAIVVVGIDGDGNIYVLDIIRFKTDRILDYYNEILQAHIKWDFRKLRAEVTTGQKVIVKELKEIYFKKNGLALSIDEHNPTRHMGSKEERMAAVLEPRYDNLSIWHYKGGMCQTLEEELILAKPPHDDIKDALASVIDIAIAPKHMNRQRRESGVVYHGRFGGVG